ncbi:hypothetical protein [Novosphingobium sp.]|uniref:hypothetical protein n=1 Tax=Novosphingobium sp. TaxID=1874826 RepID=UPI0035B30C23
MSVAEIGAMIPIVALMIPIVAITTRHKRNMAELEVRKLEAQAQLGSGNTSALEERLRVLERIVTDKGYDVAHQIEALRDARQTEALLDQREAELRK